jgi:hypothetical protein
MARDRKIPDLADMFKDHDQRIRNLESNNRIIATGIRDGALIIQDASGNTIVELGKASDGNYGVRVNDQAGNPQVRVGQLASGGYGLEAVNNVGALVSLSTLAFGMQGAQASGTMNNGSAVSSTSYITLTDGPSVSVTIGPSKRCMVIFGCSVLFSTAGAFTELPTYLTVLSTGPSGQHANTGDPTALTMTLSSAINFFHNSVGLFYGPNEGIDEAGTWTFVLQARVGNGSAFFGSGSLLVLPY